MDNLNPAAAWGSADFVLFEVCGISMEIDN